ncbi:unnamed protein product [Trichogramma brassicae]|uniref:Uncharacterized protein n=1 Tax=Trichogramma brassicae TaxID=86971 RepID=A0A6H5HVJ5_9HYME|nr:unnamed protein product [Trichogramma brassicae]
MQKQERGELSVFRDTTKLETRKKRTLRFCYPRRRHGSVIRDRVWGTSFPTQKLLRRKSRCFVLQTYESMTEKSQEIHHKIITEHTVLSSNPQYDFKMLAIYTTHLVTRERLRRRRFWLTGIAGALPAATQAVGSPLPRAAAAAVAPPGRCVFAREPLALSTVPGPRKCGTRGHTESPDPSTCFSPGVTGDCTYLSDPESSQLDTLELSRTILLIPSARPSEPTHGSSSGAQAAFTVGSTGRAARSVAWRANAYTVRSEPTSDTRILVLCAASYPSARPDDHTRKSSAGARHPLPAASTERPNEDLRLVPPAFKLSSDGHPHEERRLALQPLIPSSLPDEPDTRILVLARHSYTVGSTERAEHESRLVLSKLFGRRDRNHRLEERRLLSTAYTGRLDRDTDTKNPRLVLNSFTVGSPGTSRHEDLVWCAAIYSPSAYEKSRPEGSSSGAQHFTVGSTEEPTRGSSSGAHQLFNCRLDVTS